MAKVTVLWSGGFDSTALAYYHLDKGDDVQLLSVQLENNQGQGRAESWARRWIGELMDAEFTRVILRNEVRWPRVNGMGFSLPQPPLWLAAAVYNVPEGQVSIGWVKGDDVWHHRADLAELLSALNKFRDQPIELITPFEWMTKEELVKFYFRRPLAFQAVSSSEQGNPWTVGPDTDAKCVEMRTLALKLKELRSVLTTDSPGIGSLPRDDDAHKGPRIAGDESKDAVIRSGGGKIAG